MRVLALVLTLAAALAAQETAWSVTERDRGLDRALDLALAPPRAKLGAPRTLVVLVDPTPSVRAANFGTAFQHALVRNADKLKNTQIAVAVCGRKKRAFEAGDNRTRAGQAVANLLQKPRKGFQNVHADVRREAGRLKKRPGVREILLVTFDNGDLEDDVEATAKALTRAKVRCSIVAREAFLSDTYWVWGSAATKIPKGLEGRGSDGPFIELPWGWALQFNYRNDVVGSGFAAWGLSRIAAASNGRVYLWHAASSAHECTVAGVGCVLCDRDHLPHGLAYWPQRLKSVAPSVAKRKKAFAAAAKDPFFRAMLSAWERSFELGITRVEPRIKRAGRTLKPRRTRNPTLGVERGLRFKKQAEDADRLARSCDDLLRWYDGELTKAKKAGGAYRYRAMADVTRALIHITRYNLLAYAAWLREVAPVRMAEYKAKKKLTPPEVARLPADYRVTGVGMSNVALCHGVKPFLAQRLPGGERMRAELVALDQVVARTMSEYAFTPFASVLRRSGLARFYLSGQGKRTTVERNRPTKDKDDTTTESRPEREGPEGTGTGGSPTSGGG